MAADEQPRAQTWEDESTDDRRRAWRRLLETHRELMTRLEAELQQSCGISTTWYDVLIQLKEAADQGRRLTMSELAAAVVISKGGLTKLVDRMEAASLLARHPRPGDRRVIEIALTADGLQCFERSAAVHRDGITRHFVERITPEQGAAMAAAFTAIREGLIDTA